MHASGFNYWKNKKIKGLLNLKDEIIYGLSSNKLCVLIIQIDFEMYH